MKICLNGEVCDTQSQTLEQLLLEFDFNGDQVATAAGGVFVARRQRAGLCLEEGMQVEVLVPVQGG